MESSRFEGLVLSPPTSRHCFGFVENAGIVVVFTAETADDAHTAWVSMEEYLTDRSLPSTSEGLVGEFQPISTFRETDQRASIAASICDRSKEGLDIRSILRDIAYESIFSGKSRLYDSEWQPSMSVPVPEGHREWNHGDRTDGRVRVHRSNSGTTFLVESNLTERALVFTPEEVLYELELQGYIGSPTLTDEGALALCLSTRDDSELRCFDASGVERRRMRSLRNPQMAFGDGGRHLCYKRARFELAVCDLEAGTEDTLEFDDEVVRIDTGAARDGFEVGIAGPVISHHVDIDGRVRREFERETPYGPVDDIVRSVITDTADIAEPEVAFDVASTHAPDEFRPHVRRLVEGLTQARGEMTAFPEQGFRNLAEAIPGTVAQHTEDLLQTIPEGEYNAGDIATSILCELVAADHDRARIRRAAKRFLTEGSYETQGGAADLAESLLQGGAGDRELIELLSGCLEGNRPLDLSIDLCRAIGQAGGLEAEAAAILVSRGKVGLITEFSHIGSEDRMTELAEPIIESYGHDPRDSTPTVREARTPDRSRSWPLHRHASEVLQIITEHQPASILPHLDQLILDLIEDGEASQSISRNGREVLEILISEHPEGLTTAVDDQVDLLQEALERPDIDSREVALKLLAQGSVQSGWDMIREIAATPDHPLWEQVQALADDPTSAVSERLDVGTGGRLAALSDSATSLHLPTPAEIGAARTDQEGKRNDQLRRISISHSYMDRLEEGAVNPPLSRLADIWAVAVDQEEGFDSFPTGPRCRAVREAHGRSLEAVAAESDVDRSRLESFESEAGGLTCHEVGCVIDALPMESRAPAYPDRPTTRALWIAYVEALAEALGELPTAKVARRYDDAERHGEHPDGDATAELGIPGGLVPAGGFRVAFDSWNDVLESLDIETGYRTSGTPLRGVLIQALKDTADAVDGVPSGAAFARHTEYTTYNLRKEFGGIGAAREAAGVEKETRTNSPTEPSDVSKKGSHSENERTQEQLNEALVDLAELVGGTPTTTQMNAEGEFPVSAYYAEFDSWNDALEAAGISPERAERTADPADELRGELRRLADELGRRPKTTDVRSESEFSLGRYYNRYDSWDEALADARITSDGSSATGQHPGDGGGKDTERQEPEELIEDILADLEDI
jgi:hypothetical protein